MDELEKTIKRSQIVLVVLSPEAVQSQYVRMEYRYARTLGKLIIPLEYRPCPEVPIDLNSLQWVNFQQIYGQGLSELLITLSPVRIADIPAPAPAAAQAQQPSLTATSKLPKADLVPPQPAPPRPEPSLMDLYRAGVLARAANDLERTAVFWQQILDRDPQFQSGILATQMQKLQEELHPWRIKRLRDRAREAHSAGEWSQEVGAWQALLALEPGDNEAKTSITLAKKHQKYAWMYENAVQFVAEGAVEAARLQLEMLWQEDREYGDPADLGKRLNINPFPRLAKSYTGSYSNQLGKKTFTCWFTFSSQNEGFLKGKYLNENKNESSFEGTISLTGQFTLLTSNNLQFTGSIQSDGKLSGSWINTTNEYRGAWNASPDG